MTGNVRDKRLQCKRKKVVGKELKDSSKRQKKEFQRKFRNSKNEFSNGNMYRKVGRHEKWKYVS